MCEFVFGVFFDFNNAMNKINDLKERNLSPFCNVSSISLDQYKVVKTILGSERAYCLYAQTCTLHIFTLFTDSVLLLKQGKSAKTAKMSAKSVFSYDLKLLFENYFVFSKRLNKNRVRQFHVFEKHSAVCISPQYLR